jgi:hypothetical protein
VEKNVEKNLQQVNKNCMLYGYTFYKLYTDQTLTSWKIAVNRGGNWNNFLCSKGIGSPNLISDCHSLNLGPLQSDLSSHKGYLGQISGQQMKNLVSIGNLAFQPRLAVHMHG